jgi:hypothetical protein
MNGYSALGAVGYKELRHTGLFRNGASIGAFLDFYSKYDFMKVPEEAVVEKLSPEEERMVDEVSDLGNTCRDSGNIHHDSGNIPHDSRLYESAGPTR